MAVNLFWTAKFNIIYTIADTRDHNNHVLIRLCGGLKAHSTQATWTQPFTCERHPCVTEPQSLDWAYYTGNFAVACGRVRWHAGMLNARGVARRRLVLHSKYSNLQASGRSSQLVLHQYMSSSSFLWLVSLQEEILYERFIYEIDGQSPIYDVKSF